jgi:hypothetical protein
MAERAAAPVKDPGPSMAETSEGLAVPKAVCGVPVRAGGAWLLYTAP